MNAVSFNHQAVIQADLYHLATTHPSQADRCNTHLLCFHKSLHEIVRVPAGRDAYQAVPGARLGNNLTDKDMLEADVVGYSGHHCSICGEIDCSQRDTPSRDRVQKLDGDVRRVAA